MKETMDDQSWTWDSLDHSRAATLLAAHLPGVDHASLEPFGQGDFCLALKHGRRVVRVARHLEAAAALWRESCVLAQIATMLPVPVPQPTHHAPRHCPPFTVHEMIDGKAFTRDAWATMSVPAREKIAGDLATFLRALHAVPLASVQACGLAQLDASELARSLRKQIRNGILWLLERDTQRRLDEALERWSLPPRDSQDAALLHRDIAPGHLLFDPPSGSLSGVIDFGDVATGPPARDFIYLYEDYGPDILEAVLSRYAGKDAPDMLPAIRKWYLLETLSWAVQLDTTQQCAELAHGLAEIEREVAAVEW